MPDKALLCGINNYASISDLRGCLNDVDDLQSLLVDVFKFDENNVKTLRDKQVTKSAVEKQWQWLLRGAKPGDRLVFHFSGHGSYTDDRDGDEGEDGVDELICLYDMDWEKTGSYLLDDDLRRMTEQIPDGVFFTFLFDSCHSGTATKMAPRPGVRTASLDPAKRPLVDVETSLARLDVRGGARTASLRTAAEAVGGVISPESTEEERDVVLVRFVEPPAGVLETLRKSGVRRAMRTAPLAGEMNHVLLAGSQSDQTSADAFIEGDYHGAFTYHLCRTVRKAGSAIDHRTLIRDVRLALQRERFSQVPQLEPEGTTGPLFRRATGEAPPLREDAGETGVAATSETNREVVTLLRELIDVLKSRAPVGLAAGRAAGGNHLVYVHGICRHDEGFSNSWWNALAPHLPQDLRDELVSNRHEVLWSDLVTPSRALEARDLSRSAEEQELAQDIRDILEDRAERQALEALPEQTGNVPGERGLPVDRAMFGIPGLDCVDDFIKYLTNDSTRANVLDRFFDVIVPLLSQPGSTVHVVSHSWGTVVAYEALRALDDRRFDGDVGSLFTVGSALSIRPVRRQLRPADWRRPALVRRWINLDADGDVVGGPLKGRPFAVDEEYLNLQPVGCRSTLGVYSPACAHSSYFHTENDAVNRGVFTRFIRG